MSRSCSEFWEGVVEIAEGKPNPSALAHTRECSLCAKRLADLTEMMKAADARFYDAPASAIEFVTQLMPAVRKVRAGLLRSSLGLAGARADADDFQLVMKAEDVQTRLMYIRDDSGWEVLGRLPSEEWTVTSHGRQIEPDDSGRFSFRVAQLSETEFTLASNQLSIDIPSAEELLSGGTESAH